MKHGEFHESEVAPLEVKKIVCERLRRRFEAVLGVYVDPHINAAMFILRVEQELIAKQFSSEEENTELLVEFDCPDGWVQALRKRLGWGYRKAYERRVVIQKTVNQTWFVCPHVRAPGNQKHIQFLCHGHAAIVMPPGMFEAPQ